jgi:hypothetical protein
MMARVEENPAIAVFGDRETRHECRHDAEADAFANCAAAG